MSIPFAVIYAHAHRFLYAEIDPESRSSSPVNPRRCEAGVWSHARLLWRQCRKRATHRVGTIGLCRVHKPVLDRAAAAEAGRKGLRPMKHGETSSGAGA